MPGWASHPARSPSQSAPPIAATSSTIGADPSESRWWGGSTAAAPKGNNGTIKIDGLALQGGPANEPHVECEFALEFSGYDQGDLEARVTFALQAPATSPTTAPVLGNSTAQPEVDTLVPGEQLVRPETALPRTGTGISGLLLLAGFALALGGLLGLLADPDRARGAALHG